MLRIKKRPNTTQRVLTRGYRELQKVLDPAAYAQDCVAIAEAELNARHEFYVVPDLNKSRRAEPDNLDNLSDEERERWFGKSHNLHPADVDWEAFEKVLMPREMPGAVGRVNGALNGSHNNERFATMLHSTHPNRAGYTEAKYTPRTVSIYGTKEQAIVAAKVLRILTKDDSGKGSVASILAEAIDRGQSEPVWVVSDNMNLQTHNALRLYFTNQAKNLSPERCKANQQQSQQEVNRRLFPGERWEAFEGVPTLLTLQGRPGVKMFKKKADGKDDSDDVKHLSRIPKQDLPRIVKGVPHDLVISSDGRQYFDSGDTFATIACLLVGPKGYTFLRTGDTRLVGELLKNEIKFATKPLHSTNTFAAGYDGSIAIKKALSGAASKALTFTAGTAAVLVHGSAIVMGTSAYSLFKHITGTDPMKNAIKQWVEERCGPLEQTKLFKVWEPRETLPAIGMAVKEPLKGLSAENTVDSPLGPVTLTSHALKALTLKAPSPGTSSRFKPEKPPTDMPHDFKNYMKKKGLWPVPDKLEVRNSVPDDFFEGKNAFYRGREDLAIAFARWFEDAYTPGKSPTKGNESLQRLTESIEAFTEILRKTADLPGDVSNALMESTRESITRGMGNYLNDKIVRQAASRA